MRKGTIALVGTLDTKGPEVEFLKQNIEGRGHRVIVLDCGILGSPSFSPDITHDQVVAAAGFSLSDIIHFRDVAKAIHAMSEGLRHVVKGLYESGKLDGIMAIGGGQGTAMASPAIRELPYGIPKLMVSTLKIVQAGLKPYTEMKDIMVMPSPADIAGLNRLTRKVLTNAAGAISGMVEAVESEVVEKPLILMGMMGAINPCGLAVKSLLEDKGYEVIVFHTIGLGGKALEEFVASNPVVGVIELAINEIGCEIFGGLASAGEHRLEAAGRKGVPQVITPGSAEFINFLGIDTIPSRYMDRKRVSHNPQATGVGLHAKEMETLARAVAGKLNVAKGPTAVVIPLEGFSDLNKHGEPFYNAENNRTFIDTLKKELQPQVLIRECNAHINDQQFAECVIQSFEDLIAQQKV